MKFAAASHLTIFDQSVSADRALKTTHIPYNLQLGEDRVREEGRGG